MRATQYLIGLCIFACFDAISSWIAFGPGERQFSGTFMFGDAATNAAIGRIAFGTGAVMDAGVTKGNYSARAILKAALPRDRSAFKRRFGLEFDF
ncbi:MAG: hypothetical protein WBV43_11780 [Pseudolabrys sp.]